MVVVASWRHSLTGSHLITNRLMKRLLELSVHTLPWLMLSMAALTLVTMMVVLYRKKQQHEKIKRKN